MFATIPSVEVRLLGPVTVAGPRGPADLAGPRQRAVIGLLALVAGTVMPSSRLIDALWGEDPPRTALRTLHSHVSRVRHALEACGLPDVLVTREPGYLLQVPRDRVDVHRFEEAVRAARTSLADRAPDRAVALLAEGLAQWHGDAYADAELDGWAAAEAERLDEMRLAASEDLWDTRLRLGNHGAAVDELDRLLVEHPTRERLVGLHMLALYRAGRPAEALDRYERLRVRLAEEFGADPSTPLQDLHRAILRGDADHGAQSAPAAGAPRHEASALHPPAQLPPAPGYFAGREAALRSLDEWLDDPAADVRLAVVTGPAGIGKTALAVHWAHRAKGRFPDGQLFLDLRGHHPDTALAPADALDHALRGLGVPADRMPASVADRLSLYRSLMHDRRVLVVLDNGGSADHILPLVPPTSNSMLVVASRQQLAALAAHHATRLIELDVLDPAEAQALLRGALGADRVAREPVAAAELAELCGRIPLALRIAAAKLAGRPRQPIGGLAAELAGGQRLDGLSVAGDSRSVRNVFASAYHALSEPAARLFRLLGLHPGPSFTAHLASAVADLSHGRARRNIDELAATHLVTETDVGRYQIHDLIRLFARERTETEDEAGQRAAAVERILDWYLAAADAANRILDPARDRVVPELHYPLIEVPFAEHPEAVLAFLDAEHANIMAVVAYAESNGHERHAWQLSYLLAGFFESRGHAGDRIEVYRRGLAAAQRIGDKVVVGLMHSGLGVACIAARRYDEALGHLNDALMLMRAGGDRRGEGHAYNNIAVALMGLRRFEEAIAPCERALGVHTANGHTHGVILGLNNLGYVYGQTGRIELSFDHLNRGLALAHRDGEVRLAAAILHSLGETHRGHGADEAALSCFSQALELRRETGNRHYEVRTLNEIGVTLLRLGECAAALAACGQAYEISRQIDDQHLAATSLANLGRGHLAAGDLVTARDELNQALALRLRAPDADEEAGIRGALADLATANSGPPPSSRRQSSVHRR